MLVSAANSDTPPKSLSFGIFSPEKREHLGIKEKRWVVLLSVRCLTTLFSLVGMSLFIVTFVWSERFFWYGDEGVFDILGMSPLAWSILVCMLNIMFFFFGAYPLHPGINVAFDLIAWMVLVIAGVIDTLDIIWDISYNSSLCDPPSSSSVSVYYDGTGYSGYGFPSQASCLAFQHRTRRVESVGITFLFLCAILHFALWVQACRRTHTRRLMRKMTLKEARAIIERNNMIMAQSEMRMAGTGPESTPLMHQQPAEQSRVQEARDEEISMVPRTGYAV